MKELNILELMDEYMDAGMSEDDAGAAALYDLDPAAYTEAVFGDYDRRESYEDYI